MTGRLKNPILTTAGVFLGNLICMLANLTIAGIYLVGLIIGLTNLDHCWNISCGSDHYADKF
jgi:hypothetical protein